MSAIFGLVCLDGRPVSPEHVQAMAAAMAGWGPDGVGSLIKGSAGLGHARLSTTPEACYERMPWKDPDSEILITAAARLDNRDELCGLFHISMPERPTVADGRLVALAFARWGEDTPEHLFGDWSFAVWNGRERRLFIARDHLGNTGLFYGYKPPFFAFASTPRAILALPEFPGRLDEWRLARYLAIFPGEEAERSRTFWEDVRLLLPAHQLAVTPHALKLRKYWRIEDAPAVCLASEEEYLEGFLDHFRRAIRVRLRADRPIGSQLSAGLDSGAVTALAAEALHADGRTLLAFTSVPIYPAAHLVPGALADEWPLAKTVAEKYDNIEHVLIRAEGVSPLRVVRDGLHIFGHPLHAAVNLYWIQAIHDEARRRGLGVLLTGQMGNGGVSWSGGSNRIFFLLVQGRWSEGLHALRAYKEKEGCSWYGAIRRHLLGPLLGPLWQGGRRVLRPMEPPWGRYSAIHPDFARRMGLLEAMGAEGHDPFFTRPRTPEWERRRTIEMNAPGGYIHHYLGAAFRMEVRDPTADVRLITFCLGVPDDQYNRDGGERMLLRRSLAGVLPEEVRVNCVRGRQAADAALRLLDYREEMEEALAALASRREVAAYVDVSALRGAWQDLQAAVTPRTSQGAASLLLRGVMAGCFLVGLADRKEGGGG
jgi:asparagine synthase (glutamine-hydrolysing)